MSFKLFYNFIQAIYIGTINPTHNGLTKAALTKGKAVLCEKPLGMNVKEVKEVIELAKEKKVFLMEGIWSRCFPAYKSLREELASGSLGEVLHVNAVFGTLLDVKERTSKKEMGGGTILDIGVYNVQLASLVFGGERPLKVLAGGHLNKDGVEESSSASLVYGNGRSATLVTHGRARMSNEAYIVGTKGSIKVPMRFWCPTELETVSKGKLTFELPKTERSFNYANSVGLLYEGDEVRKCLKEGLTESPLMPLDETVVIAEIMEDIRKQVGVVYPQD